MSWAKMRLKAKRQVWMACAKDGPISDEMRGYQHGQESAFLEIIGALEGEQI